MSSASRIEYSEKYADEVNEYRYVEESSGMLILQSRLVFLDRIGFFSHVFIVSFILVT